MVGTDVDPGKGNRPQLMQTKAEASFSEWQLVHLTERSGTMQFRKVYRDGTLTE